MVLTESFQVRLGEKAQPFHLKGVDDTRHSIEEYADARVLAIVFMCNHCPYVQACIDRLIELQRDFAGRGVQFVGINSNDSLGYPEDSFEAMRAFSTEKGMNFPYLLDDTQQVARAYHAMCTPDIFVYDTERLLRYHGRIDNNWKDASKVTSHDLRDALTVMLGGRGRMPDAEEQSPSMGCSIKWRESHDE